MSSNKISAAKEIQDLIIHLRRGGKGERLRRDQLLSLRVSGAVASDGKAGRAIDLVQWWRWGRRRQKGEDVIHVDLKACGGGGSLCPGSDFRIPEPS